MTILVTIGLLAIDQKIGGKQNGANIYNKKHNNIFYNNKHIRISNHVHR